MPSENAVIVSYDGSLLRFIDAVRRDMMFEVVVSEFRAVDNFDIAEKCVRFCGS